MWKFKLKDALLLLSEFLVGGAGLILLSAFIGSVFGAFAGSAVFVYDLVLGAL